MQISNNKKALELKKLTLLNTAKWILTKTSYSVPPCSPMTISNCSLVKLKVETVLHEQLTEDTNVQVLQLFSNVRIDIHSIRKVNRDDNFTLIFFLCE